MHTQPLNLDEALQQAVAQHQQGVFQEAERLYRSILAVDAGHPDANHNLGILCLQFAKPELALPHFKTALEANPGQGQYWLSYANALAQTGRFRDAVAILRQGRQAGLQGDAVTALEKQVRRQLETAGSAATIPPASGAMTLDEIFAREAKDVRAIIISLFSKGDFGACDVLGREYLRRYPEEAFGYTTLGTVYSQTGRDAEAVDLLTRALGVNANDAVVHNNRGNRDAAMDCFRQAIALNPDFAQAHANLGKAQSESGLLQEAAASFARVVDIMPQSPDAHVDLGDALQRQGCLAEAVASYNTAIALSPDNAVLYNKAGVVQAKLRRFEAAIAHFSRALALAPDLVEAHINIASAYQERGCLEDAMRHYRLALESRPDEPGILCGIGTTVQCLGRIDEAMDWFLKALRVRDNYALAWYSLCNINIYCPTHEEMQTLLNLVEAGTARNEDAIYLHFAMAKMYQKHADTQQAFRHFERGHACRISLKTKTGSAYDHDMYMQKLACFRQIFTTTFFEERRGLGLVSRKPIFIVGFPRSGTSLVEQILASHTGVFGAVELEDINRLANMSFPTRDLNVFSRSLAAMTREGCSALAGQYLQRLEELGGDSERVVDKMPHNFEFLWLIALLFPQTTILHCSRSPEDTCLSCYCTNFTVSHEYTDSLEDLGRHYRYYQDMMELWRHVLPVPIHEVRYESLVTDPEAETRHLLAACGLDFEPACLEFHKTKRAVRTASATQVREKVYTSSVGRWRRYEAQLAPLLAILRA